MESLVKFLKEVGHHRFDPCLQEVSIKSSLGRGVSEPIFEVGWNCRDLLFSPQTIQEKFKI